MPEISNLDPYRAVTHSFQNYVEPGFGMEYCIGCQFGHHELYGRQGLQTEELDALPDEAAGCLYRRWITCEDVGADDRPVVSVLVRPRDGSRLRRDAQCQQCNVVGGHIASDHGVHDPHAESLWG